MKPKSLFEQVDRMRKIIGLPTQPLLFESISDLETLSNLTKQTDYSQTDEFQEKARSMDNAIGDLSIQITRLKRKIELDKTESRFPQDLQRFESKRKMLCKGLAERDETDLSKLYPQEYFPYLWVENKMFKKTEFQSKIIHERPQLIHTVWRGISPEELQYIISHKHVKSNQSMNIGYEVEQGLTVYAPQPSTAIHYADSFAPVEKQPTDEKPNYIIQIKVKPENGVFVDGDSYIKTPKAIPSNQIEFIWEIRKNGHLTDVTSKIKL
jgi:hypothetical protein